MNLIHSWRNVALSQRALKRHDLRVALAKELIMILHARLPVSSVKLSPCHIALLISDPIMCSPMDRSLICSCIRQGDLYEHDVPDYSVYWTARHRRVML